MEEKLIIRNKTDLPMTDILLYAFKVVQMGRVSGNKAHYCYATTFEDIACVTRKNKDSDTLTFIKED